MFGCAIRDILTRRIPGRIPTFLVAFVNAGFVALGGAALALSQGLSWPEPWQVGLLAIAACVFLAVTALPLPSPHAEPYDPPLFNRIGERPQVLAAMKAEGLIK